MTGKQTLLAALVLAIGVAAGGWFVGHGFEQGRKSERYVTVKGLSERVVMADTVVWRMSLSATSDNLTTTQEKLDDDTRKVLAFLKDHQIGPDAVTPERFQVLDRKAQAYGDTPTDVDTRYIVNKTIVVRTDNVAAIVAAAQDVGDLLKAGVVLSDDSGPAYIFTGLNDVKPEMIAEATRAARASAEQFASDSGSKVGAIRRANQGVFSILGRAQDDAWREPQSVEKLVRVVSTIEFDLKD